MPKRQVPGVGRYELKDGTVRFKVVYRDSHGKQTTKRSFHTWDEAETWYYKQMGRVKDGDVVIAPGAFDDEFAEVALRRILRGKAAATASHYRHQVRDHHLPFFRGKRFAAIDHETVEDFLDVLLEKKLAPTTVNVHMSLLAQMFDVALSKGYITKNPARARPGEPSLRQKVADAKVDYLSPFEVREYLAHATPEYQAIAEVLVQLGLRAGEACGLFVSDVNLAERYVWVERQRLPKYIGDQLGQRIAPTKNEKPGKVHFGPRLETVLRQAIEALPEPTEAERAEWRAWGVPDHERLFYTGSYPSLTKLHAETLTRAGLRHVRVHDLRHTAAALWLAAGEDLFFVQRQLRHKSIKTTDRYYAKLAPERGLTGAKRAEEYLWNMVATKAEQLTEAPPR